MTFASDEYAKMMSMGFISLEEIVDLDEEMSNKETSNASSTISAKKRKAGEVNENGAKKAISQVDSSALTSWTECDIPEWLASGLINAGLASPTLVQRSVLFQRSSQPGSDILIRAPTGSGKTLSYLLPILSCLSDQLMALIIVPTRELACQVRDQLKLVCDRFAPFHVRHACLVGGMSREKQDRQLSAKPHFIVATPGRLVEILDGDELLKNDDLRTIPFLVLDEADRLLDKASGHYQTMKEKLIPILQSNSSKRITFMASATLDLNLMMQSELRCLIRKKDLLFVKEDGIGAESAVNPSSLKHYWLPCQQGKKEETMVAMLSALSSGRVIVFVNAIESVGKVVSLLKHLGIQAVGLHAHLQQRQRLQHLDKFKEESKLVKVLVASDVAARGLDLPAVDWVIHLHVARTLPIHQHRSGRSGRAGREGNSLVLVSPEEAKSWKLIQPAIKWQTFDLPINPSRWQQAVHLAQQLIQLNPSKAKRGSSWEERAAEALGVDLESDNDGDKEERAAIQRKVKTLNAALKRELSALNSV